MAMLHIDQGRYRQAETELRAAIAALQRRLAPAGADPAETRRGMIELGGLQRRLGLVAWERGETATALTALQRAVVIARRQQDNAHLRRRAVRPGARAACASAATARR